MAASATQLRVAVFGTALKQFNGYSKVLYELFKQVVKRHGTDVKILHFGFQQFYKNEAHRNDVPAEIECYDAWANEDPKQAGFGVGLVKGWVERVKPDVCVVFNDMMVLNAVINDLKDAPNRATFKIIAYIDQVYLSQRRDFIQFINTHADAAIAFTPEWRNCILSQGLKVPCDFLAHGFNPETYYPVPRNLARRFFGLNDSDFLILNLNRNQPRKRWDTCMKAFAEVVHRLPDAPIKMVIGTDMKGAWDIIEVFERELAKRGVSAEVGKQRIIVPGSPQQLLDFDTNILYNIADIGINTCDGEGFGLCNFEQAGMGIPQVVPRLGGFVHFFDDDCALMVDPKIAIYVDSSRDGVGGEALLGDYADFADKIIAYYSDPELRRRHGRAAREKILREFRWEHLADKFVSIVTSRAQRSSSKDNDKEARLQLSMEEANSLLRAVEGIDPLSDVRKRLQAFLHSDTTKTN